VAREEDAEFVECLECGDIFESSEFKDMMIEDTRLNKGF
jgi:Zn ribbon nucleic-acid-binding protein